MDASLSAGSMGSGAESADSVELVDTIDIILMPEYLYQNDLLLVAIRDRWRLNPFVMVAGVMALTGGVLFGLYAAAGLPLGISGYTARAVILTFIAFPLMFWLYLTLPDHIAKLFNTLAKNKVIGAPRANFAGSSAYEDVLEGLIVRIDSFWWAAGSMTLVGLYWLYRLLVVDPHQTILYPLWLRVAILVVYAPMMYSILLTIIRLLVTLFYMNKLFKDFDIRVNPLYPDGSAGLGILGDMLRFSVFFVSTMGITALTMNTTFLFGTLNTFSIIEAVVQSVFYFGLALTLVIGWLKVPHEAMMEARYEVLQSLADEFLTAMAQTIPQEGADTSTIQAGTNRLSELNRRYQLFDSIYPTWPVEIVQVRRLVGAISLPALIALLWPIISKLIPILIVSLNNLANYLHV